MMGNYGQIFLQSGADTKDQRQKGLCELFFTYKEFFLYTVITFTLFLQYISFRV